jgi:Fe2+ or Zn2+ uptake regulation protein
MTDFEPTRKLILLLKLIEFDEARKKPKSLVEYERFAGFDFSNQDVRKVLKMLIDDGVLTEVDKIGPIARYKINMNKLEDFIENTEIGKLFIAYFNEIYSINI